jgi:hypothetical protein
MPESSLRLLVSILFFCLAAALASPDQDAAPAGTAEKAEGPVTLLELTDSNLIASAWGACFPDSQAPAGEYHILIPPGTQAADGAAATVFLLRNGTQAGALDRSVWEALASEAAGRAAPGWAQEMEGPEKQDVPILWRALRLDKASLLLWADWPSGFAAGTGTSFSAVPGSQPQIQRDIDIAWTQRPFGHFPIGIALHRSQYGGGLTRLGEKVADTAGGLPPSGRIPEFWGPGFWWWGLSAGVPGLRYTLALANQPLPRFAWLDPAPAVAIRTHRSGRLVRQWTGTTLQREGNFSHTLDARLGILRYGLLLDMDAYRVPVHTIGLDDLPSGFGSWGGELILASSRAATHVWMDIPDLSLSLGYPEAYPSRFRFAFLRLDMEYLNTRSFRLGLSVRLRVENPIMNRPGA